MKLIKCYIENFGILHTQEIAFSKGLNCCISENGTGKTTLTAFIEAMLYGIGDTRKQSLDENARKKYSPWQGGRFGGSLTIEVGKKRYVIERSFGARPADDTFRLIDADSGKESPDFGEDVGERLFGIDRDGFLRTVFLSERNLQGKNDNKSISAKLSDLVGVNGDVGGIDDALKLLEDRRKYYHKKGNTGEISNVKARIVEYQRRLDNVTRLEGEVKEAEAKLTALADEKRGLDAVERGAAERLEQLGRDKAKNAHEQDYANMLAALNAEKEKLAALQDFFSKGMPTTAEVDSARDRYNEAERLKGEALAEQGNEEYVELAEFFKSGTSFRELAEMERQAERLEDVAQEIASIENSFDPDSQKMKSIFPSGIPAKDDIDEMKKAARSTPGFIRALLILIGLGVATAGALIGNTVGYAIAGAGLLVSLFSAIFLGKSKKSKEMLALARKFNGCECSNLKSIIEELEDKLEKYDELDQRIKTRLASLKDEEGALKLSVCTYLSRFPVVTASTIRESVQLLHDKFSRFRTLAEAGEMNASGKIEKLKRSEELMTEAKTFLSRYPTVSTTPFAEIRDKIIYFGHLIASVSSHEKECDVYAVRHGVTGKAVQTDPNAETQLHSVIKDAETRMKAINEEYTLISRELSIARAEVEKKDEGRVALFDFVTVYNEQIGREKRIQIVTTLRQDATRGFVSKESPLGRALMGGRVGDRVRVDVNENKFYYAVIRAVERGEDNEELPISAY